MRLAVDDLVRNVELHLELALLPRLRAQQLVFEARDETTGAQLDGLAAPLAALERLAVDVARVVEDEEIAVLRRALDRLERSERVAQALQLRGHLLVVCLRLAPRRLDALVVAELGLRAHGDLDGERQRRALVGKLAQVDLRMPDRRDVRAVHGLLVPIGNATLNGLAEQLLAADALEDDLGRHLALAEARNLHVATELGGCSVQLALDCFGGHLDVQADARFGQFGRIRRDRHRSRHDSVTAMRLGERFMAWLYTGPLGHLYGTAADVTGLWIRYLGARLRP